MTFAFWSKQVNLERSLSYKICVISLFKNDQKQVMRVALGTVI